MKGYILALPMFLITKGYTGLTVDRKVNIAIAISGSSHDSDKSINVIVTSLETLLRFEINGSKNLNKEQAVQKYLGKLGWSVEQQTSQPR